MSEATYPAHCEKCRLAYRINLVLRPPAACEAINLGRDGHLARCGGAIVRSTEAVLELT